MMEQIESDNGSDYEEEKKE